MQPRLFATISGRLAGALAAALWMSAAAADDGPRYTYFGAGYEWADVKGAVKQSGAQHDGLKLDLSVGLVEAGPLGVHFYAEWFDGDFSGLPGPDLDSTVWEAGLGLSFAVSEYLDLVAEAGFLNSELENVDDDGFAVQGLVRGKVSDKVELEAGYRYEELSDSDISNNNAIVGILYSVTPQFALRASGVVFDDDTGFELGIRWHFGELLGRDFLFR
jgi:hypothetical protein